MPIGHNSKVKAGPISADRLKAFIERIEKLEEERKSIGGDIKDVYAEAKGVGYDIKTMRKVVSLRAMDPADRAEQETLLEVYWHALQTPDRIDARLAAGESQRAIAEAEGVSKSTVQRRGPEVAAASAPSKMDHHDSDGVVTERGGEHGKAEADDDAARAFGGGETQGQQQRESGLADGRPVQHEEAGNGADAGGGTQRLQHGVRSPAEDADPVRLTDEAPAPRSVGAVVREPATERVASPFMGDDPGEIPAHLRGPSAANRGLRP